MPHPSAAEVIDYWYAEPMRQHWFASTPELDADIRRRFEPLWQAAQQGRLDSWRASAQGCLALAIVLDQLPLNMFRGQPDSFATEAAAIAVCRHAIEQGFDKQLPTEQLAFLYMPLMHGESLADQDEAVALFEAAGLDGNARFARHHRDIVRRFGRFPHRNAILDRVNSPAEAAYLAEPGAFTG